MSFLAIDHLPLRCFVNFSLCLLIEVLLGKPSLKFRPFFSVIHPIIINLLKYNYQVENCLFMFTSISGIYGFLLKSISLF